MQFKYRSLNNGLFLFIVITLFISCGNPDTQIDASTVFRYNEHANITSLDPAFAKDQRNIWAVHQIYNSLVKLDDSLNIVGDLAKSWQVSNDGLTYSFELKEGITFYDPAGTYNRAVNARDVVYSLRRLTDPQLAAPGAWTMEYVASIQATDYSSVSIELSRPFPAFMGILSMKFCSVIPHGYTATAIRDQPVGTGPFYLKRWEENIKMVLRRNPNYHERDTKGRPLPYLEAVAITFKSEKQTELLELKQGKLDFISGLDPSYKDELLTTTGNLKPAYRNQINIQKAPFLNTEYLGINLNSSAPELQSPLIRRALNLAFDRVIMIKYLRNNIGTPAVHGMIPTGLQGGGLIHGYSYNPEEARQLVAQFKKKSGIAQPEVTITTGANYLDLCEYIQKEVEAVGIKVIVEVMPPSTLRQARKKGSLDIFRSSWIADYPDAQNYLSLFYSKNKTPYGPNYTSFEDSTYDRLYTTSLSEKDHGKRLEQYRAMDSLVMEQAAVIPLYYDQSIRFVGKNIHNFVSNPVNLLNISQVYKQ